MSKALALLSGKGGSGKTTLALSMASMLSDCNIKVLLIDCDLSTNGATYFYESKLSSNYKKIASFYEILFNEEVNNDYNFIGINPFLDFIPSISQITDENTKTYSYLITEKDKLNHLFYKICSKYDITLFDCQAGYTDILKLILPLMDINLVVMEADAMSSAALRGLYLKIGNIISDKKMYQLFNKVTKDEYEIYSKLSGGTVFTNIESIIFDWKIRKAFSVAQIPDIKSASANYGKQIYNVCKILLTEDKIQKRLHKYEIITKLNENEEDEKTLKLKIDLSKGNKIRVKKS